MTHETPEQMLARCPFCDGEAELCIEELNPYNDWFVSCSSPNCFGSNGCDGEMGYALCGTYDTKAEAIAAWNTRTPTHREAELQRRLEIKSAELNCCLIRESRIIQVLTKIMLLLPPKPLQKDGVTYEYNDPNAMQTLNLLSDRIDAIPTDIDGPVKDCMEALQLLDKPVEGV